MNPTNLNATNFHSAISTDFDKNYTEKSQFVERRNLFLALVQKYLPSQSKILDLGCGPGVISEAVAKASYAVTGIDGSPEMINIAINKTSGGDKRIDFFVKDIPFTIAEFDLRYDGLIASSVLEYIDKFEETIDLIYSLLKQDGILLVSMPNTSSIYRLFEQFVFRIIGKPVYLNFVINKPSKNQFLAFMKSKGYEELEFHYFGNKGVIFKLLKRVLPNKYTGNLYLCVFKKTKIN